MGIQTLFQSLLQMTLQFVSVRYGSGQYVIRYLHSAIPEILLEKDLHYQSSSFYNNYIKMFSVRKIDL